MTQLTNPYNVLIRHTPEIRDINRMKAILQKQGQIEPLQVLPLPSINSAYNDLLAEYTTFENDAHGDAIVVAARELKWPTILIVVLKRYEY